MIPKLLVATAPEVPGISAQDFFRRKINAAIHRLENVGGDLRKNGRVFSRSFRFVDRLVFFFAGERGERASRHAGAASIETKEGGPRCQQYLHRAIIDMSIAKRVARKFLRQIP